MYLSDEIVKKLEIYKKRYDDILEKLTFEEVLIDEKLTVKLSKDKAVLEPIVLKYEELKELEALNNQNQNYEENKYLKDITRMQDEILKQLVRIDSQFEDVCIEIVADSTSLELFDYLKNSYVDFFKQNGYDFCEIENKQSNVAVLFNVNGADAYQIFSKENGVHKSKNQSVKVLAYQVKTKQEKFDENDVKFDIYRSSGAGGQNVNKVSTAIRATHLKTRMVSICQDERSQFQNKERALQNLKEKVEKFYKEQYQKQIEKDKKQNIKKDIVRYYNFDKKVITDAISKKEFDMCQNVMTNILRLNKIGNK